MATTHPHLTPILLELVGPDYTLQSYPDVEIVSKAVIIPLANRIEIFLAEWLKVSLFYDGSYSIGYNPAQRAEQQGDRQIGISATHIQADAAELMLAMRDSDNLDIRLYTAVQTLLK